MTEHSARAAAEALPSLSGSPSLHVFSIVEPPGIRCVGDVDPATHATWQSALAQLPPASAVHLDLSGLRFIDTHGVLLLVEASQSVRDRRRLVLHEPPAGMLRVLRQFWPSLPTLEVHRS
ncbi:STAS domain-containing protein [Nocardia yunnanensis]|uniref:STAS domain-containing protein n=1 Tax=Nocardia yunnanensis TaxID=2382165 RepID=A0A386ZK84_9NOCA|nr:STAS domain-containing protein [Nocardia yunnanensis]AYF77720.1 STAS domain-containing protein [Nocardia yunnanensis]